MCSNSASDAAGQIAGGVDALADLDWQAMPARERLSALDELERLQRRITAVSHTVIDTLSREDVTVLGDRPPKVIADRLRISLAEARRRIKDAGLVADRLALTGLTLPPVLPATAVAWRAGRLDGAHLDVITGFLHDLPAETPFDKRESAEVFLVEKAGELRPDQLAKVAAQLAATINPDGAFTDVDRARKRGFTWSPQYADGMSKGVLWATPELRAGIDAYLARFGAPGMCNPTDQTACVAGEPSQQSADADPRTPRQRNHDALSALLRSQLGDPALGQHRGLPVTVIVSTTLKELQAGAGQAVTAGGTLIPLTALIRMASHAWHYLTVFDDTTGRPLWLGRSKRCASADQRIVLHSLDRGCTHPGCDKPGYQCEVHHVDEWAAGGRTDVDRLTFACKCHHKLLDMGWKTRKLPNGDTEWIPPPQLDIAGGVNNYHHPERFLPEE
jgi:hypothetical protein